MLPPITSHPQETSPILRSFPWHWGGEEGGKVVYSPLTALFTPENSTLCHPSEDPHQNSHQCQTTCTIGTD